MKKKMFNLSYSSIYRRYSKKELSKKIVVTPLTLLNFPKSKTKMYEDKMLKMKLDSLNIQMKNLKKKSTYSSHLIKELINDASEILVKIAEFKPEIREFLNQQPQTCNILSLIKYCESIYEGDLIYNRKVFKYFNCPN